jgi:hypothetical protein
VQKVASGCNRLNMVTRERGAQPKEYLAKYASQRVRTTSGVWLGATLGEVIWYVDDVERARSTAGVPDEPMYVIANPAVGGDWPGNPDATTVFPGFMDIDYIRVYQRMAR